MHLCRRPCVPSVAVDVGSEVVCAHATGCTRTRVAVRVALLAACVMRAPRVGPGRTCRTAEIRGGETPTAPRWLRGLGGEVSCLSWRLILPGEAALIPVTHSLEEFKAARWREGVWESRFRGDSLILL